MNKVKVIISFDIEFTINGAFSSPESFRPLGAASLARENAGEDHGLGFALDCMRRHELPGTFFIESLCAHWFGLSEMQNISRQIAADKHDLQLHIHPCWREFKNPDWANSIKTNRPNDSIMGRKAEELRPIISDAIEQFVAMTGKHPSILRTGNLHVDREAFRVFKELGLHFSSSIGTFGAGYSDSSLNLKNGVHQIEGVTEIPISSYFSQLPRKGWRLFSIPGSSSHEIEYLLNDAYQKQISPIVILCHASDFSTQHGHVDPQFKPNTFNKSRFEFLCSMLAAQRDKFSTITFEEFCADTAALEAQSPFQLQSPFLGSVVRLVQNNILPKLGVA